MLYKTSLDYAAFTIQPACIIITVLHEHTQYDIQALPNCAFEVNSECAVLCCFLKKT